MSCRRTRRVSATMRTVTRPVRVISRFTRAKLGYPLRYRRLYIIIYNAAISRCVCEVTARRNAATEAERLDRLVSLPSLSSRSLRYRSRKSSSAASRRFYTRGGGAAARGREDNYRFEIVYVRTLMEPRRLDNSRKPDPRFIVDSLFDRRGSQRRGSREKTIVPFYTPI